jgi:integrase
MRYHIETLRKAGRKPNTIKKFNYDAELIVDYSDEDIQERVKNGVKQTGFFSVEKRIEDITKYEAKEFQGYLKEDCGLALSTANKAAQHLQQFFLAAVEAEIIEKNPLAGINYNTAASPEKKRYISNELSVKICNELETLEEQLRFVLFRWLGLRCASEINTLKWEHVNFETNQITIIDSKNERFPDKKYRYPEIPNEVLPFLKKVRETAGKDAVFVCPATNHHCRDVLFAALNRLQVEPWPQLHMNLRRSAITDGAGHGLPAYKLDAWFGNSETIRRKHYYTDKDVHREAVRNRQSAFDAVTHEVTQQASVVQSNSGYERNKKVTADKKESKSSTDKNEEEWRRSVDCQSKTSGLTTKRGRSPRKIAAMSVAME